MLKKEWLSIWKDKKLTLSIIVMFFMPLLYAGMLLYAFWDPYDRLDQLPVAIVNDDQGAVLDGESLQLGEDLMEELRGNKELNFIETSYEDGKEGLLKEEYYLLVRVPENFSQHATTLLEDNPQKLELEYYENEGSNFLSAQIGSNAIGQVRAKVNEEIAKTYATSLYEAITKLGGGYTEASDAATKISDGVAEVKNGTQDLKDYLYQLASSTVTLADGTTALQAGFIQAANGSQQLQSGLVDVQQGATQLEAGMQKTASGAGEVAQGVNDYTAGVTKVYEGQQQLDAGQQQLQTGIESVAANSVLIKDGATSLEAGATDVAQGLQSLQQQLEQITATLPEEQAAALQSSVASLVAGSQAVADGATSLSENTSQFAQGTEQLEQSAGALVDGQSSVTQGLAQLQEKNAALLQGAQDLQAGNETIASKMTELTNGTAQLVAGSTTLQEGLTKLKEGSSSLSSGTSQLAEKSGELAQGSEGLVEGTLKLDEGSSELASSLKDAAEEAAMNVSDEQIEMTVSPVELKETTYNEVSNYGVGFAPYFISLGLFVGSLLLTNVYPYVQPVGHPTNLWSWFASKSSIIAVVGVFQIIFTYVLLKFGLGLEVQQEGWLILTIVITSFAFLAIVQAFTVVLGDVGRFLALVFLIVQLAGSAGTFPLELLPAPLQMVHEYLPMSYSVHAFRAAISTNDSAVLTQSLTTLGVIGIVSVLISFAFFALLYKRRYSKVQQEA
ncbi:MAG: YhgE/Pip domain-containing protein [Solibacillus sp.]